MGLTEHSGHCMIRLGIISRDFSNNENVSEYDNLEHLPGSFLGQMIEGKYTKQNYCLMTLGKLFVN